MQYAFGNFGSPADDRIVIFTCPSNLLPVSGEWTSTFGQPWTLSRICITTSSTIFDFGIYFKGVTWRTSRLAPNLNVLASSQTRLREVFQTLHDCNLYYIYNYTLPIRANFDDLHGSPWLSSRSQECWKGKIIGFCTSLVNVLLLILLRRKHCFPDRYFAVA